MGCCQSIPDEHAVSSSKSKPSVLKRSKGPAPANDNVFADTVAIGPLKVLTSCAAASQPSTGRSYTRVAVQQGCLFAALFEAHGGSNDVSTRGAYSDAAAQFCVAVCLEEFNRQALERPQSDPASSADGGGSAGGSGKCMQEVLSATFQALDDRYLASKLVLEQDRLGSGCTAVLLHLDLTTHAATVATLGPCAAIVGARRGGLASATGEPRQLAGGGAESAVALGELLASLAAGQPLAAGAAGSSAGQAAIGFGRCKGLGDAAAGHREPLTIQTAHYALQPSDESLVLLSGAAAAAISPNDAVYLMHRFAQLSKTPAASLGKAAPLDCSVAPQDTGSKAPAPLMDSLKGSPPGPLAAGAGPAPTPFNAARLLVQHATATAAARQRAQAGLPPGAPCIVAFSLDWSGAARESGAAPAAAASTTVLSTEDADAEDPAAARRRRAQYLWHLVRLYYKFPARRRAALVARWHELLESLAGAAGRQAREKELMAWQRLGQAVQVSRRGDVKQLEQVAEGARTPSRPGLGSEGSQGSGCIADNEGVRLEIDGEAGQAQQRTARVSPVTPLAGLAAAAAAAGTGIGLTYTPRTSPLAALGAAAAATPRIGEGSAAASSLPRASSSKCRSAIPTLPLPHSQSPSQTQIPRTSSNGLPPTPCAVPAASPSPRIPAAPLASTSPDGPATARGTPRSSVLSGLPPPPTSSTSMGHGGATTSGANVGASLSRLPRPGSFAAAAAATSPGPAAPAAHVPALASPSKIPVAAAAGAAAIAVVHASHTRIPHRSDDGTAVVSASGHLQPPASHAPSMKRPGALAPLLEPVTEPAEEDLDLLSPDAEQLAMWAAEAAEAMTTPGQSVSKATPPPAATPASLANVYASAASAAAADAAASPMGGAHRPVGASRIPLSPGAGNAPKGSPAMAAAGGSSSKRMAPEAGAAKLVPTASGRG